MSSHQHFLAVLLTIFISLLLSSCHSSSDDLIADIIQPLNLTAGQTDTIPLGDLFFASPQAVAFKAHHQIDIRYDSKTGLVIFSPRDDAEGLYLLNFDYRNKPHVIPVRVTRRSFHTFSFRPAAGQGKITVFGSFNSWNRANLPLRDADGDGLMEVTIPLEPGRYEYKFYIEGEELLDPSNPEKVSNPFGSYNSVITIPPPHPGTIYLHLTGFSENGQTAIISLYAEKQPSSPPLAGEHIIALLNNHILDPGFIRVSGNEIELQLNHSWFEREDVLRIAVNQNGLASHFQTFYFQNGKPRQNGDPFIWHDAILYAIMIDRFYDGDPGNSRPVQYPDLDPRANFHGGDLQGILDKIEEGYFRELGVNVLWLSPVNQNTHGAFREYPPPHRYFTGYHGYWPIHHQQVDFRFGDLQLFKQLVKKSHANDMKIILDFVANHVHQEHPFYQDHPEWFGTLELPDGRQNIRLWDEYRLTTWFDTFLPSFDYSGSRPALEAMTENAVWWVRETGIDGFRQDAVKHIPNEFWRTLTRKLKQEIERKENKKTFQIGETFGGYDLISSYVNNGQLSAQFNFNLYDVALQVFLTPEASFQVLNREMEKTFQVYGVNHLMGNLMDSHDKVRYLAYADGDVLFSSPNAEEIGWNNPPEVNDPLSYRKAQLYLAYLFTIPGIPVVYYGDEIGMTGAADPDNRRPMRFGDDLTAAERIMFEQVTALIHLRNSHTALRYGDFLPLLADDRVYAFIRSDLNGRILTVLNKSEQSCFTPLSIPALYKISAAHDLRSGEKFLVHDGQLTVEIPSVDWKIYQLLP